MNPAGISYDQLRLLWDVEALLKCKACKQRITPPVVVCRIGHCTCKKCNSNGHMCVVCNKFIISDRFIVLENLLHTLPRRCKYFEDGCKEILPSGSNHEKHCPSRPRSCELGRDTKCRWAGGHQDWLRHARSNSHVGFVFWNAVSNLMFVQYYLFPSTWEFYNILLNFESSLFMLYSFKSEQFLHVTVKYVGHLSMLPVQMPAYSMKITFLRESVKYFSVKLDSEDERLAMCEDVPLSELAPLVNNHQELDMYVELCVQPNRPCMLSLEEP